MKAFKAEHGRCNVPESHGPLGKWVATQRQAYKKGKLPEERILKLDALGFVWNPTPSWDERLGELMKYQAEQGHCNVPAESQGSLGIWVANQRRVYRKKKLSGERVQKLDALGFLWNPLGTPLTWDERFKELTKYKAEHGDCTIPVTQGSLGGWVGHQRHAYKKGKLSEERVRKLDALGFSWGWGTIPNSKRRPAHGSRPRSDAGEAGDGEGDVGRRERKKSNAVAADDNDAGAASAPARSTTRSARNRDTVEVADPSQSAAWKPSPPR